MRKPCHQPGCPYLTTGTWCEAHQPSRLEESRRDVARRGTSRARGYDRDHERLRDQVLKEEPFCRVCLMPTVIADHIVPIAWGGARLDRANLQGLCFSCHEKKKAKEKKHTAPAAK